MIEDLAVKEEWVGYCEMCGLKPIVKSDNEAEAVNLSLQAHNKIGACDGGPLIVAAFRRKEVE